jgi:hypothetical protein
MQLARVELSEATLPTSKAVLKVARVLFFCLFVLPLVILSTATSILDIMVIIPVSDREPKGLTAWLVVFVAATLLLNCVGQFFIPGIPLWARGVLFPMSFLLTPAVGALSIFFADDSALAHTQYRLKAFQPRYSTNSGAHLKQAQHMIRIPISEEPFDRPQVSSPANDGKAEMRRRGESSDGLDLQRSRSSTSFFAVEGNPATTTRETQLGKVPYQYRLLQQVEGRCQWTRIWNTSWANFRKPSVLVLSWLAILLHFAALPPMILKLQRPEVGNRAALVKVYHAAIAVKFLYLLLLGAPAYAESAALGCGLLRVAWFQHRCAALVYFLYVLLRLPGSFIDVVLSGSGSVPLVSDQDHSMVSLRFAVVLLFLGACAVGVGYLCDCITFVVVAMRKCFKYPCLTQFLGLLCGSLAAVSSFQIARLADPLVYLRLLDVPRRWAEDCDATALLYHFQRTSTRSSLHQHLDSDESDGDGSGNSASSQRLFYLLKSRLAIRDSPSVIGPTSRTVSSISEHSKEIHQTAMARLHRLKWVLLDRPFRRSPLRWLGLSYLSVADRETLPMGRATIVISTAMYLLFSIGQLLFPFFFLPTWSEDALGVLVFVVHGVTAAACLLLLPSGISLLFFRLEIASSGYPLIDAHPQGSQSTALALILTYFSAVDGGKCFEGTVPRELVVHDVAQRIREFIPLAEFAISFDESDTSDNVLEDGGAIVDDATFDERYAVNHFNEPLSAFCVDAPSHEPL